MSKATDLNERIKKAKCQWCSTTKSAEVGALLLCPKCDRAVLTLAATAIGRPPVPPTAEG